MIRIPLVLVTGFLGSGKTTCLRHLSRSFAGRRIVFLVNEFSSIDVDGALLRDLGPDTVSVPGGSIFCRCLVTDFISTLRGVAQNHHSDTNPLEGVIIEASGVANPLVINDMLKETRLDELFTLKSVVSLVDPGSFHKLLLTLPAISAQIEAADLVLINKCDLFPEEKLRETEAAIRKINQKTTFERTVSGRCHTDFFAIHADHSLLHGEYAKCADPHFGTLSIHFTSPVNLPSFTQALAEAGEDIYRAKGFLPTPAGTVYIDFSASGIQTNPSSHPNVETRLAIITNGPFATRAIDLVSRAEEGEFNA